MRTKKDIFADGTISFTPQELIDFEHTIKDCIAEFLPFTSYSLFFPREEATTIPEPEYRAEDKELILPLVFQGKMLCFFIAKGVRLTAPATAPKYIMALAGSVLEKLALYKKAITDPLTGLYSRNFFFGELEQAIEQVQGCLAAGSCRSGVESRTTDLSFSGTFGVLFLDLDTFQPVNERYGYLKGDDILAEIGHLLHMVCPKYTTVSRFANDKFAILVPDAKPRACFQLSEVIRSGISKLSFIDEMTRDTLRVTGSLGYVCYPQGLEGAQFRRTGSEQARMIVRKAREGMAVAKAQGRNRVFGYADILARGGRILEVLPMNRLMVSLGEAAGAKVGQRFLVRAPKGGQTVVPSPFKGEIVLVEVRDDVAFAEILHLGDAAWTIEESDRLKLIEGEESLFTDMEDVKDERMPNTDAATKLYRYSDFVSWFSEARLTPETFGLILIRILDQPDEQTDGYQDGMDQMAMNVARLAQGAFGETATGGRYGLNGMIFFQEGIARETLLERCLEIEKQAEDGLGIKISIGASHYPFLNFDRADILENSRKALEHALLLPEPHVAVFDSISMNLSADRKFMDGDIYGAIEEFKQALLADENNLLARNSLGICYGQLGRFEEARHEFESVVSLDKNDVLALYNLGWANHRLGDLKRAATSYHQCLKAEPGHVYSLVRLGSIEEKGGRLDAATALYKKAIVQPGGERMVYRSLARVSYKLGEVEGTREYLHLALKADHNDHQAMHMLAKLYLDQGEDPQIAEVLARQSAALSPGSDAYWETLVETLEAQGKAEEAAKVAARAAG
ncbi:diguanylate cyclase [Pseudodesulfovibrio sp. JC047]|uniref:tetratricopeptide repeat-containing diguanylate cyclase n=1 Tax=Pseudodesulfovibrio sp. JC047 TaxID=2683199 RepID=UPI0013D40B16|nr:diguanylate cyclase [Pseudodesulfovibrio sp. JC047]NDV19371.1 diguanylate cyclase [Pseudodesulfovibrio sp. JC047]